MSYEIVCTRGPMKGRRWELTQKGVMIGSSRSCEICVDDPSVAGLYCIVKLEGGKPVVQNLASDSGVDVNGIAVEEAELDPMDGIRAGSAKFVLSAPRGSKGGFAKKALAIAVLFAVAAAGFFAYDRLTGRGQRSNPQTVTNTIVDVVVREVVTTNTVVNMVGNITVSNIVNVTKHVVDPGPLPQGAKLVPAKNGKGEVVETTDGLILSIDGRTLLFAPRELTSVVIPDCVTEIGDRVFDNNKVIECVTIPPTVTKFGQFAFRRCDNLAGVFIKDLAAWCQLSFAWDDADYECDFDNPLWYAHNLYLNGMLVKELVIPQEVATIGNHAFRGCASLTRVKIPDSVTEICAGAFADCSNLTTFEVDGSNRHYKSVDGLLLTKDGRTLVAVPGGLEKVKIPNGVLNIGDRAFAGCSKLSNVTIPDGVVSIGYKAFKDCKGLSSLVIPPSMSKIGFGAFHGCGSRSDFYITDLAAWCRMSVNEHGAPLGNSCKLHLNGALVEDLKIPDGVTSIGGHVFLGCSSLTRVVIPRSVERIGWGAFANCCNLIDIRVDNGNRHYKDEDGVLLTRDGRTLVAVPGGIDKVKMPNGVEVIGSMALSGCKKLSSVRIPHGVTRIEYKAFSGCRSLDSVEIPNSVRQFGAWGEFECCTGIVSVTIPGSLENIGKGAFAWSGISYYNVWGKEYR